MYVVLAAGASSTNGGAFAIPATPSRVREAADASTPLIRRTPERIRRVVAITSPNDLPPPRAGFNSKKSEALATSSRRLEASSSAHATSMKANIQDHEASAPSASKTAHVIDTVESLMATRAAANQRAGLNANSNGASARSMPGVLQPDQSFLSTITAEDISKLLSTVHGTTPG